MRTLLVEDDAEQRQTMASWLEALGLQVRTAAGGEAGLLAHLRAPFDLMVIDWVTPGMDGLQLCRRVRSMAGGDRPYILVVTGRDRTSDLAAVLDAGADDYMAKPPTFDLLQTRIRIAERRVARDRRHRAAQEALAQSEADFRRVIERSSVGVLAHREGRIVYVNEAGARTLGSTHDALVGAPLASWVRSTHRELVSRRALRFERTQVPPPPMEVELQRPDGAGVVVRWVPATGAVYQGDRACFTLLEDITEKRAAERQLRLTQFAVEHAADAAVWVDAHGEITYANGAATQMSGYAAGELVGMPLLELDPRLRAAGWPRIRKLLDRRRRITQDTSVRRRDGQDVPIELTASVVHFHGEWIMVAFARDISERRRMQASLQQADRLASVGSLAAGVAHEINNPLAYVIANLELLNEDLARGEVPRAELARMLGDITEGAHRVRRIVGDLKSFARADDDELQAVRVPEVLDLALDIANNEIRHRAELVRRYGPTPPAWANSGRLTQVFLNLIVNAAHAIPEGQDGHAITVETRTEDEWVVVEISDTGVGIPPEIIDRIFDPFFSTKPQGVGTGLGLSICHGIVTSLGGHIEVRSRLGHGASFRLLLPAARLPVRAEPRRVEGPVPMGPSLRILVIDDEPILCEGIKRALREHDVHVASEGRLAIEACEREEFDVVLCDVMMPDLSGVEVFERVGRAAPHYADRFIFMTGGAFTPKTKEFLDAVSNERILKPFSLHELRRMVARRSRESGPVRHSP